MKSLFSVEVKIVWDDSTPLLNLSKALGDVDGPILELKAPKVQANDIKSILKAEYDCDDIRDGVTGGVYGARDGRTYDGITCYVPSTKVKTKLRDMAVTIYNYLGEDAIVAVDDDVKTLLNKVDNSYNHCHKHEPLCHSSVSWTEDVTGGCLAVFQFHQGGDIRGNYGHSFMTRFESMDDFYKWFLG